AVPETAYIVAATAGASSASAICIITPSKFRIIGCVQYSIDLRACKLPPGLFSEDISARGGHAFCRQFPPELMHEENGPA
ncbi:MAG: hypothetical protein II038_16245, partial [Lachnospiraceae bacterium]|nr:hypothetical protein [Lachnospiraceae bacterium]